MSDMLTQEQINALMEQLKEEPLEVKAPFLGRLMICIYCKNILKLKVKRNTKSTGVSPLQVTNTEVELKIDETKFSNSHVLMTHSGCSCSDTGHVYVSKEWLLERKI